MAAPKPGPSATLPRLAVSPKLSCRYERGFVFPVHHSNEDFLKVLTPLRLPSFLRSPIPLACSQPSHPRPFRSNFPSHVPLPLLVFNNGPCRPTVKGPPFSRQSVVSSYSFVARPLSPSVCAPTGKVDKMVLLCTVPLLSLLDRVKPNWACSTFASLPLAFTSAQNKGG